MGDRAVGYEILSLPGGRRPVPPAGLAGCSLHDVVEDGVFPYRCHRCGRCFACAHEQAGLSHWRCGDGTLVSSRPSPGVRAW